MYNYLVERMFNKFTAKHYDDNIINFMRDERIVGTLYQKEQVLNIFLSASSDIIWNHHNLAILVIAKKYAVLNNAKVRYTEAVWLIGCCGAQWQYNLKVPMYLKNGQFFGDKSVSTVSEVYRGRNHSVRFTLFDIEVKWKETEQPYSYIPHLNPALVYSIKPGGKKVKNAKAYLRKEYDWEYGPGYGTSGSAETRKFIDTMANKVNHTEWSQLKYHKVIRK